MRILKSLCVFLHKKYSRSGFWCPWFFFSRFFSFFSGFYDSFLFMQQILTHFLHPFAIFHRSGAKNAMHTWGFIPSRHIGSELVDHVYGKEMIKQTGMSVDEFGVMEFLFCIYQFRTCMLYRGMFWDDDWSGDKTNTWGPILNFKRFITLIYHIFRSIFN